MRATAAPPRGFDVATSIGTDGRGRLFTAVGLLRQARPGGFCPACRVLMKARGASQELAKPMVAALVVLAVAGGAWAAMVQQSRSMAGMDLGRDDGGDDVALRDPGGPRVRANGRTAKGMAGCHWSACRYVPRRVADLRRGVLRDLHRCENALAEPGSGGWTGSGSGRRLFPQPDQTGEPGPLPRAVRAAWAASLQPDAERRRRGRALRAQLPWMQRGAHGGHGPSRDVQSVVGGDPGHRHPHLQVRASAANAILTGSFGRS